MIHYYQEIPGWFTAHDASFYAWLVDQIPHGGSIVEVGCWRGRSLSCLLVEIANSGKQIAVTAVDTFRGSDDEQEMLKAAKTDDIHAECLRNAARAGYPFSVVVGDSVEVGREFEMVDAVFLDGCHGYDALMADIAAWLPKTRRILCGHDVLLPSVKQALTDTFGSNWSAGRGECWWKTLAK